MANTGTLALTASMAPTVCEGSLPPDRVEDTSGLSSPPPSGKTGKLEISARLPKDATGGTFRVHDGVSPGGECPLVPASSASCVPLCLIYTLLGIEPRPGKYSSNISSPQQGSRYCLTYWSSQGTELTFLLKGREGEREKRLGELAQ